MTVHWTTYALANLQDIFDYIVSDSRSEDRANRQLRRIIKRGRSLGEFPALGRVVPDVGAPNVKEVIEGSYRIIYWTDPSGTQVHIITVHHGKKSLVPLEVMIENVIRLLTPE